MHKAVPVAGRVVPKAVKAVILAFREVPQLSRTAPVTGRAFSVVEEVSSN
jgi:hypothetical protein